MSLENSLVLGRYRVLWPLESKKFIKTYIATDEHRDGLGTPVLIKHYLHDLGDKESQPATAMFEELGRLTTHLQEVKRILASGGAVGKRLDFLMQELNREANTLGSKSVSTDTSQVSMELKVLIEQMREQIQNLE